MKLYKCCWQMYTAQRYRAHLQSREANQSPPWFSQCPGCFFEHSLWPEFFFFYSGGGTVCCGVIQSPLLSPITFLLTLKGPASPTDSHPGENGPAVQVIFDSSFTLPCLLYGSFGRPPPKYIMNLFTSNSFATTNLSYLPLLLGLGNYLLMFCLHCTP